MLHHDRWIEMDAIWFDPARDFNPQIEELLTRLAPLWRSTDGMHGLCFNVSWLIDLVTEWTGRGNQKLPLRSDRTAAWAERTYEDLRRLFVQLRVGAERVGVPDLKIGLLFVGWGHVVWPPDLEIYGFASDWYDRHPELYGGPNTIIGMPDLWPINRLKADSYAYATRPNGLTDNAYFPDFFAEQWASLRNFLGVDALHLRDGMTGPMVYTRKGPYGLSAPADPSIWREWTQAVIDLYRAIKTASPETFLIGYSSAISPTAEWRVGLIDLEALVADGAIDCWIDQTWGGAWQDWWHQLWKGWTFQLANLMSHRVQIEAANMVRREKHPDRPPCKHYNLIETWDGWEPWDTLHQVPHKLRWGIWAFNHAAAITPDGPRTCDGSYISWANNRHGQILSVDDVNYLSTHLDMAQESAAQLDRVHGPLMVYNRPMLQWLMDNHPDWNASEWIEDQIGLLMKWGVPCLGATRIEWLPQVVDQVDGLIVQVPGQLPDEARDLLLKTEKPTLLVGRADLIDAEVLGRCVSKLTRGLQPSGFYGITAGTEIIHLPEFHPVLPRGRGLPGLRIGAVYLTAKSEEDTFFAYWQPPDWSEPGNPFLPKYQLGSTLPYCVVASLLHPYLPFRLDPEASDFLCTEPMCCHLWQSSSPIYVLVGNLETAVLGDSRTSRAAHLLLDKQETVKTGIDASEVVLQRIDFSNNVPVIPDKTSLSSPWLDFFIRLGPEISSVYVLKSIGGDQ